MNQFTSLILYYYSCHVYCQAYWFLSGIKLCCSVAFSNLVFGSTFFWKTKIRDWYSSHCKCLCCSHLKTWKCFYFIWPVSAININGFLSGILFFLFLSCINPSWQAFSRAYFSFPGIFLSCKKVLARHLVIYMQILRNWKYCYR